MKEKIYINTLANLGRIAFEVDNSIYGLPVYGESLVKMKTELDEFYNHWYLVEEELPEEDVENVLGYSSFTDEIYICYVTGDKNRPISGPGSVKITHWKYLPLKAP